MSKKKKKINHKSQADQFAHFHNEHKRTVHRFLMLIGLEDGINSFPEEYREHIEKRYHLPLIYPDKNSVISKEMLRVANMLLKHFFEKNEEESFPGGPRFSFAFYFTTDLHFHNYISKLKEKNLPELAPVFAKLTPYLDYFEEKHRLVFGRIGIILNAIGYTLLQDHKEMYYLMLQMGLKNLEFVDNDASRVRFTNYILHRVEREEAEIVFQNESRKAMRLSFPLANMGLLHIEMKASELGIESPFASLPLPIYIQEHAIERIAERLDCLVLTDVMMEMYTSLKSPKFTVLKKGHALIEFRLSNCKLGYFKVVLAEGALLIQTFLFLTNNGTPEGDKLNQLLGMQKADKKYWEIDKLTTFLDSDIEENEELKQLFIAAGCKSLFDYKKAPKLDDGERQKNLNAGIASMLSDFVHKTQDSKHDTDFESNGK